MTNLEEHTTYPGYGMMLKNKRKRKDQLVNSNLSSTRYTELINERKSNVPKSKKLKKECRYKPMSGEAHLR